MSKLNNKVAIVTGASKGIGKGIAKKMAAEGAIVVINYLSDTKGADTVVKEILTKGGQATAIQGDMSKKKDVEHLFSQVKTTYGRLDILVNNAGVYKFEPVEAVTEEEFHREFNVNVLGPVLTIQEGLKYFGSNGGSIVNVGSVASKRPGPMSMLYTATKASLDSITEVLAKELGGRNIRVNSVLPGLIETEGTHHIGVIGSDSEKMMIANTPLGRTGQSSDVANVVAFLASDDAGWVTGQNIVVSGGF